MGHRPPLVLAVLSVFVLHLAGAVQARGDDDAAGDAAKSPSFLSRHRQKLLIASGVGAGAATAAAIYLRRAANDRYDDYRQTADPERLEELYDEAADLDNQAAAAFIAAEAMFVFAVYLGFFVDPPPKKAEWNPVFPAGRLGMGWTPDRGLAFRLQWDF
jgi:hypothetical protein